MAGVGLQMATLICQVCSATRGMTIPAEPSWLYGNCSLCARLTDVTSPLEWVHHTGAVVPEDTGGNDGID